MSWKDREQARIKGYVEGRARVQNTTQPKGEAGQVYQKSLEHGRQQLAENYGRAKRG